MPLGCFKQRASAAQDLMRATNQTDLACSHPGLTVCNLLERALIYRKMYFAFL
jgi:hypothetical protein